MGLDVDGTLCIPDSRRTERLFGGAPGRGGGG